MESSFNKMEVAKQMSSHSFKRNKSNENTRSNFVGRVPDRQSAFTDWKQNEGSDIVESLEQCKNDLRENKEKIKSITQKCSSIKKEISNFQMQLEQNKENKTENDDNIDEEEYSLIKNIKDSRRQ